MIPRGPERTTSGLRFQRIEQRETRAKNTRACFVLFCFVSPPFPWFFVSFCCVHRGARDFSSHMSRVLGRNPRLCTVRSSPGKKWCAKVRAKRALRTTTSVGKEDGSR